MLAPRCPFAPPPSVNLGAYPPLLIVAFGIVALFLVLDILLPGERRPWISLRRLMLGSCVILVGYTLTSGIAQGWSDALWAWEGQLALMPGCYTSARVAQVTHEQYLALALQLVGLMMISAGEMIAISPSIPRLVTTIYAVSAARRRARP